MTARSEMAEAFGASVDIPSGDTGLYLVIGSSSVPGIIRTSQGQLVTSLSATRHLALLNLATWSAVKAHPEVELAGPVNIDTQRFAAFLGAIGQQAPP